MFSYLLDIDRRLVPGASTMHRINPAIAKRLATYAYAEANARANNSEYELGGTVWGTRSDGAFDVAQRIVSGTAWINCICA